MARTPFAARIQPAVQGATTYTVPAGKFAVCNFFLIIEQASGGGLTVISQTGPIILLNGVEVTKLPIGTGKSFGRKGPFVFNAGDIIGNGGSAAWEAGQYAALAYGAVGFLYDTSTRKVPVNQKLITGTTSYTIPAGKHLAANFYPGARADSGPGSYQASVMINGVEIWKIGTGAPGSFAGDYSFGPITAGAGSVISTAVTNVATPPQMGLLSGFLYNN